MPGLTTTTWYQAVITCTNSMQSYTTTGSPVTVAATTTSMVPYYESFELIGATNRLPNCSWWAPNQGTTLLTYTNSGSNNRVPRTGNNFAAFALPSTNNTMYTNGIWMEPGVTYSAATHYATEYFGYNNWTNLSILVGPNQTASGLQMVATVSPAISGPYKVLGGTFTVPTPGFYYVAINANGTTGSALYLMIDDISVTIPCTPLSNNSPTLSLSASATTICAGTQINLTANGGNTYAWSNGATGSNIVVTPMVNTTYTVTGTNTLTNCSEKLTQFITVNPAPDVFVVANKVDVCSGEQVNLSAYGASSYIWSNGASGQVITITPTVSGLYTAVGLNAFGCSSSGVQQINVKPLPAISAVSSGLSDVCSNDMITLTGNGGVSYTWYSSTSSILLSGPSINVIPGSTTTYTVIGVGANGCQNKNSITQNVVTCVGLKEQNADFGLNIYPNPTSDVLNITINSRSGKIEISDVTGRIVVSSNIEDQETKFDLSTLSNGVYYLTVSNGAEVQVQKFIKQ